MSDHLASITGDYALDPSHSQIGFSVRHAMVTTVRGSFGAFESKAHIDAEQPGNSSVTVSIETASISTGSADRDGHLSSPDFFDAAAYPQITFASTDVARDGDEWTITGDLTIKDVTRPVTIVFEQVGTAKDPFGNERAGFSAETDVEREQWGLNFNAALETGGFLVSKKVKLVLDVSLIKQA